MTASCKLTEAQKRLAKNVEVIPVGGTFREIPFELLGEQSVGVPSID